MAKFWMINVAQVGTARYLPGDELDDTVDPTASIIAAGGFLYPQGTTTIDTAAAVALAAKVSRGANEFDLALIMSTAVDIVQKDADATFATTTALAAAVAAAVQKGTTTLVAGVSPLVAATITATSRIGFAIKDPANGALTVKFAALTADRVVGAPGSFRITALLAAGTINIADTSAMDWWVFN
jgi:hypothetical protein